MCFSSELSILSFIVGFIGSILCISLGKITDKIIGYFLGFVSLMQEIEFLLWNHQTCDNYNKVVSFIGMILNHSQPIVLGLLIFIFNTKIETKKLYLIFGLLCFYTIIIIPYSIQFITNKKLYCTLKGINKPHLLWKWNTLNYSVFVYYIFSIVLYLLLLLGIPNILYGLCFAFIGFVIHYISLVVYPNKYSGAIWCFFSAFLPLIYYIIRITYLKNIE
jgi:hypothetical protein